ncbi:MAG: 30S ribosomal protein S16 [Candidatus Marinimicrobia bacterium]|nr:30S ribosomal protein S16 [Candidatus Neomarinimicrobiota bacterium]
MAVKIRLFRIGKKKKPMYRVVVMDSRRGRNSAYIEKIGFYNPLTNPADILINKEKAIDWLKKGAIPTDTVAKLFQHSGVALEYHLEKNKADEKTRQVEIQKWEMARKIAIDQKRQAEEEKLKKQAEEETANEPVVEPEADEPVVEEETVEEEKSEEKTEE